jgi:hypothetical protein
MGRSMVRNSAGADVTGSARTRAFFQGSLSRERPAFLEAPLPRISLRQLRAGARQPADKSMSAASELQDQSASLTSLTTTAHGISIQVEAEGGFSSDEFPDGFKWTQTIDTNVPKGGTTSPYVDPRPNDDTKPFYYTDAEQLAHPTTFLDSPQRPTPAAGTTRWEAVLGLNGVNDGTQTVTGFDYMSYGFTVDSAGTVSLLPLASVDGSGHRAILASEFAGWTFS